MKLSAEELEKEIRELEEVKKEFYIKAEMRRKKLKRVKKRRKNEVKRTKKKLLLYITSLFIGFNMANHYHNTIQNTDKGTFDGYTINVNAKERDELFSELSKSIDEELNLTVIPEDIEEKNDNLLVLQALFENPNLSTEEKELVCQLTNLLIDNKYLNKELAYESLSKVDVQETVKPEDEKEEIVACYKRALELIETYINENSVYYNETLIHEFIHCIFSNYVTIDLPRYLNEGMTELLSNEYYSETPFVECSTYPFEVIMVKELCNIVGENKVLKAFSTGNMEIISNELSKVTSEEEAKNFLTNVDDVFEEFDTETRVSSFKLIYVINYLNKYSKKLYEQDEDIKRLEESTYNINALSLLSTEDPYISFLGYLTGHGVYVKAYISSKLKEAYQDEYICDYFVAIELEKVKVKTKKHDIKYPYND